MGKVLSGPLFRVVVGAVLGAMALLVGAFGALLGWGVVGIAFLFTTAFGMYESNHGDAWFAAHVVGGGVGTLALAAIGCRYTQDAWELAQEIAYLIFPIFRPDGEQFPGSDKEQPS